MRVALLAGLLLCCVPSTDRADEPVQQPSDSDRARKAFQDAARKVYEEIFPALSDENRRDMERVLGCDGADCAAKAAELLVATSGAFAVTPEEAKLIAEGHFDDSANSSAAQSCAKRLGAMGLQLPYLFAHLIEKVQAKKIEGGIELELAARLLAYHSAKAQRIADAKTTNR